MEGTAPPSLDIVEGDLGVWRTLIHLLWTLLKWTSGCGRHLLWALLKGTSGIQHHRPYCWGTTQQQKGQSQCQCAIVLCAFSLFMLHIYSELSAPAQKLSRWPTVAGFSVCLGLFGFVGVCLGLLVFYTKHSFSLIHGWVCYTSTFDSGVNTAPSTGCHCVWQRF